MAESKETRDGYWALVEPYWKRISIYDGAEVFLRQYRSAPTKAGHLFAAHWCQSEVCNGGMHQFFSNSTGVLAPEAREGFQAIGLTEWASLLAQGMTFFGDPYPREQADRQQLLAQCQGRQREEWDPFYQLDERFYAWLHAEEYRWQRAADAYAAPLNT
jgi:hypothetical protein